MKCICCRSKRFIPQPVGLEGYYKCCDCGLIFRAGHRNCANKENIIHYFQKVDPHEKVANSKISIFRFALSFLESQFRFKKEKTLLDVGCGYGYFLELVKQRGWKAKGVEIANEAVVRSRKILGKENVFEGTLKEARFESLYFDSVTLMDVLDMVDNPYEELKECHRILANGGWIGIRVRNVFFQKVMKFGYFLLRKVTPRSFIKRPDVFHSFCFSRHSIEVLLQQTRFENIQIINSPLTDGDPYGSLDKNAFIKIVKQSVYLISRLIFHLSGERWVIGPSLLVFAKKPSSDI